MVLLSFHVIWLLLATTAFGGFLLFMLCFAPVTFSALEQPQSSLLRLHLFTRYYFTLSIILLLAAGFLVSGGNFGLEIAIFVGCVGVLRHILLPRMEALREADQIAFNRLHRTSVVGNLAQFAAVTIALIGLAQ